MAYVLCNMERPINKGSIKKAFNIYNNFLEFYDLLYQLF